jgi:hypothetical protein
MTARDHRMPRRSGHRRLLDLIYRIDKTQRRILQTVYPEVKTLAEAPQRGIDVCLRGERAPAA